VPVAVRSGLSHQAATRLDERQIVTRRKLVSFSQSSHRPLQSDAPQRRAATLKISCSVSALALLAATPALAQQAAPLAAQPAEQPAEGGTLTEGEVDEIVVTAERVRGQVQSASAPVLELDQAQVQAYGAASIADLVAQLSPQIGSGRGRGGRPVFLVNGQRISNFREIGRYPPESVRKVEVLPEEVAVKFGFQPDQRVINFILQDNFVSREIEVEAGAPTRGGYGTSEAELGMLRIDGPARLNATLAYNRTTPLTEAERGIIQTPGNGAADPADPDQAEFRTLVARSEQLEANVTSTIGLGESGAAGQFTLNSQWVHNRSTALSGLDVATVGGVPRVIDLDPIERRTNSDTLSLGAGYSTRLGDYQFQTTVDGGLTDSETFVDRRRSAPGPITVDTARSRIWNASSRTTLIGNPFLLPAGELGLTLNAGYDWDRIESFDTRTLAGETSLTRGDVSAGANISIPIASRRDDFLSAVGDLTLNVGGGVNRLSDFGTLGNWNTGLVWKPAEPLTLQASYVMREVAPGLSQLGAPTIVSLNVPVFDFRDNQTVLVEQTSGGNPFLRAETQRDLKLSASYDLDILDRANLLVEYYRNRSDDVTSGFPLLTPAIEAAFPDRVTRDPATGRLLAIDARPVTFAETRSERLRYGFNLAGRVGKPLPQGQRPTGGFGALMATARPAQAAAPGGGSGTPQSGGQERPGGGMMSVDPQRLAELRAQFCAAPAGTVPDLSALPQQMQDRLKGPDGQIDPARVAVMRERFCNPDAARRFDPARFAAMRQALCADPAKAPDPAIIPEEIRARLQGPDGTIAPERLREFQTRICALPTAGQRGENQASAPTGTQGGGPRGGGGGMFGPGGDGQGRWNVGLYHTINLANSVLVAPGGPLLDLLDGDATSGGGVARHQLELEGGLFYRGIGFRLSGTYTGPTTVRGSGLPGSSELFFSDLATFNLRSFVALDQQKWLVGDNPGFFKNARLSLAVNNIFDARQSVTDGTGAVPLRYQPFLIDPVGRFVEVEFRKLF
jgi:iron complex outermembrane recepter protein